MKWEAKISLAGKKGLPRPMQGTNMFVKVMRSRVLSSGCFCFYKRHVFLLLGSCTLHVAKCNTASEQ